MEDCKENIWTCKRKRMVENIRPNKEIKDILQ